MNRADNGLALHNSPLQVDDAGILCCLFLGPLPLGQNGDEAVPAENHKVQRVEHERHDRFQPRDELDDDSRQKHTRDQQEGVALEVIRPREVVADPAADPG